MDYQYKGAFSTDIIDGKEIIFLPDKIYSLNPSDKRVQKLIKSKYLIEILNKKKEKK